MPPLQPMLAKSVKGVPAADAVDGGYLFEPKWDGFRAVVFRDGDEVEIAGRSTKPLTRYFPDVVAAVLAQLPERCVVDGEIVTVVGDRHFVPFYAGSQHYRNMPFLQICSQINILR